MTRTNWGEFIGTLNISPVGDGVHWELVNSFGFLDVRGTKWTVPSRARVDGASIPRALWSLVGSPLTGLYVEASVVHDYYCDIRSRPWRNVHRVFFEAMLASKVSEIQAKIMYAAVYFAGPRWSETVEHNSNLGRMFKLGDTRFERELGQIIIADGMPLADYMSNEKLSSLVPKAIELDLNKFSDLVKNYNPSAREIAHALDSATPAISYHPFERAIRGSILGE